MLVITVVVQLNKAPAYFAFAQCVQDHACTTDAEMFTRDDVRMLYDNYSGRASLEQFALALYDIDWTVAGCLHLCENVDAEVVHNQISI